MGTKHLSDFSVIKDLSKSTVDEFCESLQKRKREIRQTDNKPLESERTDEFVAAYELAVFPYKEEYSLEGSLFHRVPLIKTDIWIDTYFSIQYLLATMKPYTPFSIELAEAYNKKKGSDELKLPTDRFSDFARGKFCSIEFEEKLESIDVGKMTRNTIDFCKDFQAAYYTTRRASPWVFEIGCAHQIAYEKMSKLIPKDKATENYILFEKTTNVNAVKWMSRILSKSGDIDLASRQKLLYALLKYPNTYSRINFMTIFFQIHFFS